jgi:FtsZ-binding cell division protein ZapB
VTDSTDRLDKLEEKLLKAVEVFKQIQADRRALQQESEKLRAELKDRPKRWEAMERDLQALRHEREDVRGRVEKLLEQIDILTKAEPDR